MTITTYFATIRSKLSWFWLELTDAALRRNAPSWSWTLEAFLDLLWALVGRSR